MYLALKSEVPCIGLGKSPSTSQPPKKRFFIDCFIQTKTNPLCRITWRWFRRICSIQIYCIPCLSTTALSSPPTVCINISISGTSEMDWQTYRHYDKLIQEPTSSKKPIRTRYLGQVTGYQPIRDQYFLVSVFAIIPRLVQTHDIAFAELSFPKLLLVLVLYLVVLQLTHILWSGVTLHSSHVRFTCCWAW